MAKLGNILVEYPSIKNVKTSIDCKVSPFFSIEKDSIRSVEYKLNWWLFGDKVTKRDAALRWSWDGKLIGYAENLSVITWWIEVVGE